MGLLLAAVGLEPIGEAESQCAILNSFLVHVGDHHCNFPVEKLAEDRFAIVCSYHAGRLADGSKRPLSAITGHSYPVAIGPNESVSRRE